MRIRGYRYRDKSHERWLGPSSLKVSFSNFCYLTAQSSDKCQLNRGCFANKNLLNLCSDLKLIMGPRCLKITEKVSFNIASEASYVYILNGQKLIKNAKIQEFKCDILSNFQTMCIGPERIFLPQIKYHRFLCYFFFIESHKKQMANTLMFE